MNHSASALAGAFVALRGLRAEAHGCEVCGQPLHEPHEHVAEVATRRARCACLACALACDRPTGRFRRIGRRVVEVPPPPEDSWAALGIPVALAFIVVDETGATAYLPGPAGALEAQLPPTAWARLVALQPALASMAPSIEALLAHRLGSARAHVIAPLDRCWQLAAMVRAAWSGIHGGDGVRQAIADFLAGLGQAEGAGGGR